VINMPGLDGTGPQGLGPMTGGARGWCNPYSPLRMGYGAPGVFPWFGKCFGFGRGWFGRGWRHWFWATGLPGWARVGYGYPAFGGWRYPYFPAYYGAGFTPQMTPQEEIEILKEQQDFLSEQLNEINKRISELEKKE
jgi:hypothetical protein